MIFGGDFSEGKRVSDFCDSKVWHRMAICDMGEFVLRAMADDTGGCRVPFFLRTFLEFEEV